MRAVVAMSVVAVVLAACGSRSGEPLAVTAPSADASTTPAVASPMPEPSPDAEPGSPTPTPSPATTPSEVAADQDPAVLSSCAGSSATTETVIAGDGPRPDDEIMDAAIAERPDLEEYVRALESEGVSAADARHAAYAQVLADPFFQYASSYPNYVEGRVAGYPQADAPFAVTFTGAVPDDFDPSGYGLESYGLEVTSGVAWKFDDEAAERLYLDVHEASRVAGLVVKDVVDDPAAGTMTVQVVTATPEQVAAFEAELDDPSVVCLVLVEPDVPCDDEVVAAARDEAQRQGEVITGASSDVADDVERSHLGLTAGESKDKAAREDRQWRIVTEEGVSRAVTSDLVPGRLDVTVCRGVVVAASMTVAD